MARFSKLRRLALTIGIVGLTATGAEALPLAASSIEQAVPPANVIQVQQSGIGRYPARQYRRAMRRYRGNPGARKELREQRRSFCRGAPEYC